MGSDLIKNKITNYILQTGDLLIPARGTAIRIAIFEEQAYPCIASSNVIVIRATDNHSGVRPHKEICYRTIKISFLFSLSIEVCQIILRVGTFQISDLVTNTAGGLIGGIIYWGCYKLKTSRATKSRKRQLLHRGI